MPSALYTSGSESDLAGTTTKGVFNRVGFGPRGTATIKYLAGDGGEAKMFADALADALREAGWTVNKPQVGRESAGLTVCSRKVSADINGEGSHTLAGNLRLALISVNLPTGWHADENVPEVKYLYLSVRRTESKLRHYRKGLVRKEAHSKQ